MRPIKITETYKDFKHISLLISNNSLTLTHILLLNNDSINKTLKISDFISCLTFGTRKYSLSCSEFWCSLQVQTFKPVIFYISFNLHYSV
jgi:hypothetical protein